MAQSTHQELKREFLLDPRITYLNHAGFGPPPLSGRATGMFFHFPATPGPGVPLASIGGPLLVDSGEADRTFLLRSQDRFLVYTSLLGLRSIFWTLGDRHVDVYRDQIRALRGSHRMVSARTGVFAELEIPEPVYVPLDLETLRLEPNSTTRDQVRDLAATAGESVGGIHLNQVSPTATKLLAQLTSYFRSAGLRLGLDLVTCREMGRTALDFHDKAAYVELLREPGTGSTGTGSTSTGLPSHVATAVVSPAQLLASRCWPELVALMRRHTESTDSGDRVSALFVKSSFDSGGNVSKRIAPSGFDAAMAELRGEIGRWVRPRAVDEEHMLRSLRAQVAATATLAPLGLADEWLRCMVRRRIACRRRHEIRLLLQPEVPAPEAPDLPLGAGFTFFVDAAGGVRPLVFAGQVYADRERRQHMGSWIDDRFQQRLAATPLAPRLETLCGRFAARGYRGPLSFDARLRPDHGYELIYDCNPRLTAVLPALAVKRALDAAGRPASSVVNLDYRGRFSFDDADLAALERRGLLYTRQHARGVLPLPNLTRERSFDVVLVDMTPGAMTELFDSGLLGGSSDLAKGEMEGLFF